MTIGQSRRLKSYFVLNLNRKNGAKAGAARLVRNVPASEECSIQGWPLWRRYYAQQNYKRARSL
jgi:hypothetical protein